MTSTLSTVNTGILAALADKPHLSLEAQILGKNKTKKVHSQVLKKTNFASINVIKMKAINHIKCSKFVFKVCSLYLWLIT